MVTPTLNGDSTLLEMIAEYNETGSYEETGSLVHARRFVTACRLLIANLPVASSKGGNTGESMEMNVDKISEQLDKARKWIAAKSRRTRGGRAFSLENFRT